MDKKKCIIDKYSTVYCFNVYVILNPDKSIVDKRFEWSVDHTSILDDKYDDFTAYTVTGATCKDNEEDCIVIVINKVKDEFDNINTISHESLHATMDILKACNVKYSDDSCEAYAYLQGYITECVYKTYKKA